MRKMPRKRCPPFGQRPAAPYHHGGGFLHTHIHAAFLWVLRREAVGRYPFVLGVQSMCPCTLAEAKKGKSWDTWTFEKHQMRFLDC